MGKRKVFSLANILIGIVLEAIFVVFLVGDVEDALTFFGLSIVCTAGASLLVWIPLAAVLGFVATTVAVDVISRRKKVELPKVPDLAMEKRNALKDYVQQAIEQGIERSAMVSLLTRNGWSESEIDDALGEISAV